MMWGGLAGQGHLPEPVGTRQYGDCTVHTNMNWFADPPRRCWVCYPEDWECEVEGRYEPRQLVPDPTEGITPMSRTCVVLKHPDDDKACKSTWDGQHTILGFAICAACYEAIQAL